MRFRSFRTSGTTGRPKDFVLGSDVLRKRVDRLAWTKGPEFVGLRSIVWLNARGSAGHEKIRTWCAERGVRLYYFPFAADGIIGSPARLANLRTAFRYRYVLSGGAMLSPADSAAIRNGLLAPGGVLYATYGASECGTMTIATASEIESEPGCVGRVLPDVTLEVVGGEVRAKTPTMAASQVRPDGWFYPGDRGHIRPDGCLVLSGRTLNK